MALNLSEGLVELTMALCDLESVSGSEAAIADEIQAALSGCEHLELIRLGNALVAKTNLGRAQRVILAGHLDTVPVARNLPTKLMHFEREQVIFGRGSVDMKGGVAVMLRLAAELTEPAVDVSYIFYDNEEVASELNGLGRIARERPDLLKADFAVLCEPTSAQIEGGCNGTLRAEVAAAGVKAHSARPWMGKNAIHALAPAITKLAAYEPETVSVEGLDYRESLNAVALGGGIAGNVIPDQATITVNYRFAPSKSVEEATAFVTDFFDGFSLTITDSAAGARPGLDQPLAQAFQQSVGASARPKYGWTDVARFSELGIAAVNFGPGDPSLAHADNENLPVGHLFDVYHGLRGWLSASQAPETLL
jgi:succinyl-diaminopimelate desuccinylase